MAEIKTLQAGRAVAALAVVCNHASTTLEGFAPDAPKLLLDVLWQGHLGVDFFFVLSGFIIYYVNHGRKPGLEWLSYFAQNRMVRVYAPYLPVGIAMALAYTLLPGLSQSSREWSWFSSATLLPIGEKPALIVAWTLRHEIVFYAIFGLGFLIGRPFVVCGVWAIAIAVRNVIEPIDGWNDAILSLINIEFLFGMLAAWAVINRRFAVLAPIAAIVCIALFVVLGGEMINRLWFGAACAFALIPLAINDARLRVPGWLMFLGAASYSIYLVHSPAMALTARVVDDWRLMLGACLAVGVIGGIIYHLAYERWVVNLLQRRKSSLETPGPASER